MQSEHDLDMPVMLALNVVVRGAQDDFDRFAVPNQLHSLMDLVEWEAVTHYLVHWQKPFFECLERT